MGSLQSIVQGHRPVVYRLTVTQYDCHCLLRLTLGIEIPVFQHRTNAIFDKQQPNHRHY